ncbi:MAG: Trigger factor [Microgenomates group bacterium GW2011_GWC1_43_13]|uniref:Trigger factor n=2 Tax=Candidatus Woeseibacteriota TaxID=1752722 RepID=A0A837IBC0_9BACT|nr:MAG: Trigger factor [Microgenomates group bacterium GW2011_GWC1_43_13]KKT32642.1 MAG: Trigger factor [Candidatus Woesebacteria bacterium GW2011_GWB1_44_11]KKT54214.1 MAG: Trigger factor [Candidatus Woesebacteria bacterium GW2011_GWA1_44_23]OGM82334.1 MAG: hypothetical protein A2394_01915 [Candidatus Woesebacteria bacterium RIFOXYB1_FULL_42_36]
MPDKITSVIARETDGNIQITFTVPFSVIRKEEDETLKEFAKDAEIPGFRKGMAPIAKVAEKIPQSKIVEHSLGHILPKALSEAVTENNLKIAVYPKFELISAEEGKDWQVRGITCELPEVNLGDYKKAVQGAFRASTLWTPDKGKPEEKKELSAEQKEQVVIKTLLENVKITIPAILIEEEADSRLSNLLSRLEKLGLALETYLSSIGKKADDLRADYANQAKDAIALDLILTKIAQEKDIKVDPKDVDSAMGVAQVSKTSENGTPEDPEGRKRLLESILKRRGALDFLIKLG